MAKFIVKLVQHTPIIHFQGNEVGALLRATDFKPRLDRFLYDRIIKHNKSLDNLIIKETALNYKLNIVIDEEKRSLINLKERKYDFPQYFGLHGNSNERFGVMYDGIIELHFFTMYDELQKIITDDISSFVAVTNFGIRQNKGYGSFTVNDRTEHILEDISNVHKTFLYINYPDTVSYIDKLKDADSIYRIMKSGMNYPDYTRKGNKQSYHKSFLFQYMLGKKNGNDKRFIKENFFHPSERLKDDGLEKKYVRCLLGAAVYFEFKDKDRYGKVSVSSREIERFKSPLTFKITDNYLCIIPDYSEKKILNKKFSFNQDSYNNSKSISTPESFDMNDFLLQFTDYFNNKLQVSTANNILENQLRKTKKNHLEIYNK